VPLREPDDAIARLEARGLAIHRATRRLADLPPPLKLDLERPLSEILDELRQDAV
jgi:hypothetical protein